MKKRWLFLLLFPFLVASAELEILATADLHGEIGNLSHLAPLFRTHPHAVKVDAGDLAQGNPLMTASGGLPMIDALNALSYDLFVPGNHDFEWGEAALGAWQKRFHGTMLAAQCRGVHFVPRAFTVLERNGVRCAFIGLTEHKTMQFPALLPEYAIRKDTLAALDEALSQIRALSPAPDAVVLIWHNGRYSSCGKLGKILSERPEIDAVICAHTHEEIPGAKAGRAVVVQPGAHGEAAALLSIVTSRHGKRITSMLYRPQEVPDPALAAIEMQAKRQARKEFSRFLGHYASAADFAGKAANVLQKTMKCDAVVFDVPEYLPPSLTAGDFFAAFPYNNRYFSVTISAAELKKLAKKSPGKGRKRFCFNKRPDAPAVTAAFSDYLLRSFLPGRRAEITVQQPGVTEWQIPALLTPKEVPNESGN